VSAESGAATFLTVNGIVSTGVALGVGWLCAKYLEGLPFRSLGASFTHGWAFNFVAGLLLGGATFALAALIGMLPGGLSFHSNSDAGYPAILSTLILTFGLFTAAAAFEEALLRGYILQTFVRSKLTLFAVMFTATVFATLHNTNPNATWLSWLNTFLAGVWLAIAYLKTRDLWLPLGVHVAWNWVQGSIFGVEVSGLTKIVEAPLMRESDSGPAWLTGGEYGIEGGVACTIALIVSILAIHYLPFLKPDPELLALSNQGQNHLR
jgi:membrane protease YdiL (CAAX protease family)